jgi:hypothetical protein
MSGQVANSRYDIEEDNHPQFHVINNNDSSKLYEAILIDYQPFFLVADKAANNPSEITTIKKSEEL